METSENYKTIILKIFFFQRFLFSVSETSWKLTTIDEPLPNSIENGVIVGLTSEGYEIYIGKVQLESGEFIPAKIIPAQHKITYEENGVEKSAEKMECLIQTEGYEWIKLSADQKISELIPVSDFTLGRAVIDGNISIGKIDPVINELVVYRNGEEIKLKEFDYLVSKPKTQAGKVEVWEPTTKETEQTKETETTTTITTTRQSSITATSREKAESDYFNFLRYNELTEQKFIEMQNKIKDLELELLKYKTGQCLESRYTVEQKEIIRLNLLIETLEKEKCSYEKKIIECKENYTSSKTDLECLELKLKNYINENQMLLKKVCNLEKELCRLEKIKIESCHDTCNKGSSETELARIKYFEETIKTQRERIFELELMVENSKNHSETNKSQCLTYKSTIEQQRIQIESFLKKLQNANTDNEFLIQKVSLLSQTLQKYTLQIEQMLVQHGNAKTTIASLTAELSRVCSQLSKYQGALSSAYVLNGELMTKMSGMNSLTQYQCNFESKCDILSVNLNSIQACAKSFTYCTPALLEAVGSDTYKEFFKMCSTESVKVFECGSDKKDPIGNCDA
ncbi:hypothetical protein ACKWTF_004327 [Chironomus riparius]